jgi:ribosome-associated protein
VIEITSWLAIPDSELRFVATRSGGPGGQNVNKVATRVTLFFDLDDSPSLSPEQKARIRECLATRVSKDGVLRVTSQVHRSQSANREETVERFVTLLRQALNEREQRVPTRVSRAAKQRRLAEKKQHARLKAERSARPDLDE